MISGPIPTRVNHRKLATEKRKIEGVLPASQLERFSEAILGAEGDVAVSLSFRKGRGRSEVMIGQVTVPVSLECQNCMQPMRLDLKASYRHLLVQNEDQLLELEDDEDGIVCPSEMVDLADLIEDELLLALPMVARHESGQCAPEDDQLDDYRSEPEQDSGETYKPFAGLAELTKDMIEKS